MTDAAGIDGLLAQLALSLKTWDDAYVQVLGEWPPSEKQTEERIKIAVRNEMRVRHVELPEIVRWRLRAAVGYRSEEGE